MTEPELPIGPALVREAEQLLKLQHLRYQESAEPLRRYTADDGLAAAMEAYLLSARKPPGSHYGRTTSGWRSGRVARRSEGSRSQSPGP